MLPQAVTRIPIKDGGRINLSEKVIWSLLISVEGVPVGDTT